MPWGDKAVSPVVYTPGAGDASGWALDNGVTASGGKIGIIRCPYDRINLVCEYIAPYYKSVSGIKNSGSGAADLVAPSELAKPAVVGADLVFDGAASELQLSENLSAGDYTIYLCFRWRRTKSVQYDSLFSPVPYTGDNYLVLGAPNSAELLNSSSTIRVNGLNTRLLAAGADNIVSISTTLPNKKYTLFGAYNGAVTPFTPAYFYGLLIYSGTHGATDKTNVENWLDETFSLGVIP